LEAEQIDQDAGDVTVLGRLGGGPVDLNRVNDRLKNGEPDDGADSQQSAPERSETAGAGWGGAGGGALAIDGGDELIAQIGGGFAGGDGVPEFLLAI